MIRTSHYLFAALCLGSLFACSRQFTDSYIVPKWCFAVFMLFIVLAYEAVNILFYRQNEQKDTRISVYGFIIVISCFLQAMFGVVQFSVSFRYLLLCGLRGVLTILQALRHVSVLVFLL